MYTPLDTYAIYTYPLVFKPHYVQYLSIARRHKIVIFKLRTLTPTKKKNSINLFLNTPTHFVH